MILDRYQTAAEYERLKDEHDLVVGLTSATWRTRRGRTARLLRCDHQRSQPPCCGRRSWSIQYWWPRRRQSARSLIAAAQAFGRDQADLANGQLVENPEGVYDAGAARRRVPDDRRSLRRSCPTAGCSVTAARLTAQRIIAPCIGSYCGCSWRADWVPWRDMVCPVWCSGWPARNCPTGPSRSTR